jgi:formylglycine-generating enzyme required for sulfatase activity
MYQDLHLHFVRTEDGSWRVQLDGLERTSAEGRSVELHGPFPVAHLLPRCAALRTRTRRAFEGDRSELANQLALIRSEVLSVALELGRVLSQAENIKEELAPYVHGSHVRLWLHLDAAPELEELPWEALFLGLERVVELRGWQVLRARARRDARARGALAKVLVLVGNVEQPRNAPEAHTATLATVGVVRDACRARGIPFEVGVAAATHAATGIWQGHGVTPLVSVDDIGRWIASNHEVGLFLALGHACAELDPAAGANALLLDSDHGVRERWTLPVTRVLPEDTRPTLTEMLRPTAARLAIFLGCEANERLAAPLVEAVDHVVGMRCTVSPELAGLASRELVDALLRCESVGSAVRSLRHRLGSSLEVDARDGVLAPLCWAPAHWTSVTQDEPFLDERAQLLRAFRHGTLAHLDGLEGELQRFRHSLSQVAVPLDVGAVERASGVEAAVGRRTTHAARGQLKDLVLAGPRCVRAQAWVLLGKPGSGKTTSLRALAGELAQGSLGVTPLYVSLARWSKAGPNPSFAGLVEFALAQIALPPGASWKSAAFLAALASEADEGRLVVLLDGLDEVGQYQRTTVEMLLRNLALGLPRAALLVTSRSADFAGVDRHFREIELLPLDEAAMLELLQRWYAAELPIRTAEELAARHLGTIRAQGHSMRELAEVPLFLNLMGRKLLESEALAASLRHEFLVEITTWLLESRNRPADQRQPLVDRHGSLLTGREVLGSIALVMSQRATHELEYAELLRLLRHDARVEDGWGKPDVFLRSARATGLFRPTQVGVREGPWAFWHRAFQEGLTAEALLLEQPDAAGPDLAQIALVARSSAHPDTNLLEFWREPFALLAGHLGSRASEWIALLLEDPGLRTVGLAAVATADFLAAPVLARALEECIDWREARLVYEHMGARLGTEALAVLAQRGRKLVESMQASGARNVRFELHFLLRALDTLGDRKSEVRADARAAARAILAELRPDPAKLEAAFLSTPGKPDLALWARVAPAEFRMGSPLTEEGRGEDEGPVSVQLLRPYCIARVPVTLGQYRLFDPHKQHGCGEDERFPVTEVTWLEAELFCRWLDQVGRALVARILAAAEEPGLWHFRLPTEAQWEFACRDGGRSSTRFVSGDDEAALARVAVFGQDHPERVTSREASPGLGLFDMHGCVWEWCADWYASELRGGVEPAGPALGTRRVVRGGSYWFEAGRCRSAARAWDAPHGLFDVDGFRVVLVRDRPGAERTELLAPAGSTREGDAHGGDGGPLGP